MFRNPRENALPTIQSPVKPSIGRPPTPPHISTSTRVKDQSMMMATAITRTKSLTPRTSSTNDVPMLGRRGIKKPASTAGNKTPSKPNASILSFFKKVESPIHDDSIFLGQNHDSHIPVAENNGGGYDDEEDDLKVDFGNWNEEATNKSRFNEGGGASKRRKTDMSPVENSQSSLFEDSTTTDGKPDLGVAVEKVTPRGTAPDSSMHNKRRILGPFIDDSEDDLLADTLSNVKPWKESPSPLHIDVHANGIPSKQKVSPDPPSDRLIGPAGPIVWKPRRKVPLAAAQSQWEVLRPQSSECSLGSGHIPIREEKPGEFEDTKYTDRAPEKIKEESPVPQLKAEITSVDQWADFDDIEEFPDEFAGDGEEFMERKWVEQQAMLEDLDNSDTNENINAAENEQITAACPICSFSLDGVGPENATKHVNGCLDGKPITLPRSADSAIKPELKSKLSEDHLKPEGASKRFARRAAKPRPGQADPAEFEKTGGPSSAFSKLMSGHAEDAAWATAAAAEHAARGKPAYERTCPFYKIMPGLFICVDAFRYGAVQGCNAYFLSHFHSDHYIGLTSSWCHGPIYCSKVTGNLVKQQLRVDPKYVFTLEFEEKVEVPGTQGVSVTMIPANHCPGSSLYLFEKLIGRGKNPKIQRVLHCGDFRACPAHIEHPLLMPDIVDTVTNKTKQQKIDVCYLDTTYLNPRYSFPSQEDVIKACADMCVSLRKERAEESDAWEISKKERAGIGMSKYLLTNAMKSEDVSEEAKAKTRGRLLIICGTYSIGKERICMGIARAIGCKIYAPPAKMRICSALEDPELMSRMTPHPLEAQIHMQALMEIRPETLSGYLDIYRPHFSRIVAFRPSGWNYKPPISRGLDTASVDNILRGKNWKSGFGFGDLVPQRGSTREVICFGVPYSEHSSFRELTMFICALRVERVVPTVNVGSARGRAAMRGWIERWMAEKRKAVGGVIKVGDREGDIEW